MTAPNLGPSFGLHAAGKITGATGALADPVNTVGAVRNAVGDYTITLGSEIDATQREVILTARSAGILEIDPLGDTDGAFKVLSKNAGGIAADVDFGFIVQRTSVPS